MTTKEILSKRLPAFLIWAAVLLLVAACSQDESIIQWEEDTLCTRETFPFTEEELLWPTPTGLEYQSEEYRENWRLWRAQTKRAEAMLPKYEDLFSRQPNVWLVGIGLLQDEAGEHTGQVGFIVSVTEKVDQGTLPPEDRIPGCLERIPVEIREEPEVEDVATVVMPRPLNPDTEESNGD